MQKPESRRNNPVLQFNEKLRNSGHIKGREGLGVMLNFPDEITKEYWKEQLYHPDPEVLLNNWKRFAAHETSLPYRVGQT